MGTITVTYKKRRKEYHFPETFNECNEKQFIACCRYLLESSTGKNDSVKSKVENRFLKNFIPFEGRDFSRLDSFSKYKLLEQLDWILDQESIETISFLEPKIQKLKVGRVDLFGIHRNFGNVTWEEFIWADQMFIDRNHNMLAAILYREPIKNYKGDRDIKVDFNRYQLGKRLKLIEKLPQEVIFATLLQYKAMRNASLELKYSEIFPEFVKTDNDSDTPDVDEIDVESKFSWVKVHQNIMGDDIINEKALFKLNATTVLNNLNTRIYKNRRMPRG